MLLHLASPQFSGVGLYARISLPVLMIAATLVWWFINLKTQYSKTINFFAKHTFGVFLIHDNNYIRDILWMKIFNNSSLYGLNLVLSYIISKKGSGEIKKV